MRPAWTCDAGNQSERRGCASNLQVTKTIFGMRLIRRHPSGCALQAGSPLPQGWLMGIEAGSGTPARPAGIAAVVKAARRSPAKSLKAIKYRV
jgi:hypothetical protein